MTFISRILHVPSYGWKDNNGTLVVPTNRTLIVEALSHLNVFRNRRDWITFSNVLMVVLMLPFFYFFLFHYFSLPLLGAFLLYALIIMSTHGTIWYHRYCTHRSYTFSHPFWRILTQNLVVKTFPEETYVVSHHVHHAMSDEPGDPYNAKAGFLYCMLSDMNHQSIARDMNEADYARVAGFLDHTGVGTNSYAKYSKWGSVAKPSYVLGLWIMNWSVWYGLFFLIGGHGLACALFSAAMFWFVLVRAFNYTGHGKGEVKHVDGVDLDRSNLSINQMRPGLFSGEWHNNHHLFPGSARAGFLKHQLDLAWVYIYCMSKLGAVSSYKDSKKAFMKKYDAQMRNRSAVGVKPV